MPKRPRVSIVVIDYRGQRYWSELLESLSEQTHREFELIVVDNAGGLSLPSSIGGRPVRVIRSGANLGFAGGCNFGEHLAGGEFLVLLNNDTKVEPRWLEALVVAAELDSQIGAVCSKVVFFERFVELIVRTPVRCLNESNLEGDVRALGIRVFLDFQGGFDSNHLLEEGTYGLESDGENYWTWTKANALVWLPILDERLLRVRIEVHPSIIGQDFEIECGGVVRRLVARDGLQEIEIALPQGTAFNLINNAGSELQPDWTAVDVGLLEKESDFHNSSRDLNIASGCSLLIRKSAGCAPFFDGDFFAYFEDVDLSLKLRKNGYRIVYEPKSVVRHHRSGTSGVGSPFTVFHGARNRFWVIAKHAPLKIVWKALTSEMWKLDQYGKWLDDEYSLRRLYCSTWLGFFKRVFIRLLDQE